MREKIGFAKWVLNWVGGKQEWNESIEECMIREAKEEIIPFCFNIDNESYRRQKGWTRIWKECRWIILTKNINYI